MMREIKFRAWDKKRKIMVSDTDEIYGHPVEPLSLISTIWIENSTEFSLRESEDIVYMQSTGLKDRTGKEIYEGDVVKAESFSHPILEVFWQNSSFTFGNKFCGKHGMDTGEDIEIIGNIYENPELLK